MARVHPGRDGDKTASSFSSLADRSGGCWLRLLRLVFLGFPPPAPRRRPRLGVARSEWRPRSARVSAESMASTLSLTLSR